jgi:hypothetical protein
MRTDLSEPTEIEAMAANKLRARGADQQNSKKSEAKEQTGGPVAAGLARGLHTIEGAWVDFDPQAPRSKGKSVALRKHLRISRNEQGRYYATLHDPRHFLRLEEFRGTDREYWMVATTAGRKRIYRFYGIISEDGLTMKGRFTVYTPDGLIARKMPIRQYRS